MLKKIYFIFSIQLILLSQLTLGQSYSDYELSSIKFEGNNNFSESELLTVIESKETPWWLWKFLNSFTPFGSEPVYFDSVSVILDKSALLGFYRSNGFFQTKVNSNLLTDTSDKSVEITYLINENEPSYYNSVEVSGLEKMEEYDVNRMAAEVPEVFDSTQRFSEQQIQNYIGGIKKYLSNNGYIFGGFDSTLVLMDTTTQKVDVTIYFHLGPKQGVKDLRITKTGVYADEISDDLIKEIVDIKKDEIYDQSKVDRSELRLLKTELFTTVELNPVISDTSGNRVPIEVSLAVGTFNDLAPDIKVDNEFNSFNTGIGISYTRKNFFGDARKFNISTSFRLIDITNFNIDNLFKSAPDRDSTYQGVFDLNLKIEQPFLFGRPILTSTEFYLRSQTFTEFTENSYGGVQKFDFEMPSYTYITFLRPAFSIDFSEREAKLGSITVTGQDSLYEVFASLNSLTPGLAVELGSSKTDDILFPTSGNYIFVTPEIFHSKTKAKFTVDPVNQSMERFEETITGSAYFYRLQVGYSHYISMNNFKTSVLASKIRVGYVQPFTSSDNPAVSSSQLIPPNKTFYAGGSNSIRGWRSRELVPRDTVQYIGVTAETGALRGGTFWFEGSFEFRKKLSEYFGYALFTDYGNTWNGWKEIKIADVAVAAGAGLRVYTPIAPFRLDFGVKFYNPFDQKFIFKKQFLPSIEVHFGIGEAF